MTFDVLEVDRSLPEATVLTGSSTILTDEGAGYADQLLTALASMAVRSKRRMADLSAALCRSGLSCDAETVTDALCKLQAAGCIEHLVPLYDGGVLMSVTSRGIEHLSSAPRWTMLDGGRLFGRSRV